MSKQAIVDLERVKQLTITRIETQTAQPSTVRHPRRLLLVAAVVALVATTLLGASKLFDWRVVVGPDGDLQQGYYGDPIVVGDGYDGYATMSPSKDAPEADVMADFSHDTPHSKPTAGQLLLFGSVSDGGGIWSGTGGVSSDDSTDMARLQSLGQGATSPIVIPQTLVDGYTVTESCTQFYTTKAQLDKAELLYSAFTQFSGEQLFSLPAGYDSNISSMFIRLTDDDGGELTFNSSLSNNNMEVYGGGGSAVIEKLELAGFDNATFVLDAGEAYLSCWRPVKAIQTVDEVRFGEDERPADNNIDKAFGKHRRDARLQWQHYSVRSSTLTRDELVAIMRSLQL